ncbi:MAG: hypothetical protein ACLPWG_16920, partial [Steroidobacteraceae bacterium]
WSTGISESCPKTRILDVNHVGIIDKRYIRWIKATADWESKKSPYLFLDEPSPRLTAGLRIADRLHPPVAKSRHPVIS